METGEPKTITGPPPLIAAIARKITPPEIGDDQFGDWQQVYTSAPRYIYTVVRAFLPNIAGLVRNHFNSTFVAGEFCILLFAFLGGSVLSLLGVVAVTLLMLRLREIYIPLNRRKNIDAFSHAITAAGWMFLLTILWTPPPIVVRGLAVTLMLISTWRLAIHLEENELEPSQAFNDAVKINIAWAIAAFLLMISNVEAVPQAPRSPRDFILGILFQAALVSSYVIRGGYLFLTAPRKRPPIFEDHNRQELERKKAALAMPDKPGPFEYIAVGFDVFLFVVINFPLLVVPLRWLRDDPLFDVAWPMVWGNAAAMIPITMGFVCLKKLNARAAKELQERMEKLLNDR